MNNWTLTPLSKCLSKVIDYRGKTPKKLGIDWSSTGYRAISANNVKFNGLEKLDSINYANEELYKKWMKEEISKNDLLLTSEAPSGQVMLWDSDEKIVLSQRLYALRVNSNIDAKYLKYYLQSPLGQKEINKNNSGSTVAGISAKTFNNILVSHPINVDEQRSIGQFLYSIDKKIDCNNRITAEIESVLKTLYNYWFMQFDFPDENGKPYRSSGGKMLYNATLKKEIPFGWDYCALGDHISFRRGISYKSTDMQNVGVPFINLNSFTLNGAFKAEGTKYFNGKYKSDALLNAGDLVIAITDVTRNADIIGKSFVLGDIFQEKPLMSCDVASVSSKTFGNYYLEQLFNSFDYHEYIKHFA
jgi:type I restriction enzyme S subunit